MRKLSAGNHKVILAFVLVIIVIIAILVLFLNTALNLTRDEYIIEGTKIAYDDEYSQIEVKDSSLIEKKWDGNYYLTINEKNETYKLGAQGILYDLVKLNIDLYGNVYRVHMDGQVEKLSGQTKIEDLLEDRIYKLADRKYLVTGSTIVNDTGTVSTQNYLLIVIDKSGNTLILNNELNAKTINPMIIKTATFDFDIANEKLIYNNEQIDLKKIIGSTNQYVAPENTVEIAEQTEEQQSLQTDNKGGQNYYNNQQQINNNNNSTTIIDNSNNSNGNGDNNNNSNSNSNSGSSSNDTNKTPISKSVSLRSINTGSTYMDINYVIIDPESKYQTVYVLIEAQGEEDKIIALDKTENTYRLNNLEPNKDYKVTLAYKEIKEDGTREEVIEDTMNVRTLKVSTTLEITKISHRSNKNIVYFNLKMDSNYVFDSADVVLYLDGTKEDSIQLGKSQLMAGASSSGWSSSFEYKSGSEITIKLENIKYKGNRLDLNIEARAKVY